MGNNSSSAASGNSGSSSSSSGGGGGGGGPNLPHSLSFRRTTGALGLSRTELDRRCKPSGLYPSCAWEERSVRRLIADGKLAARMRGSDERRGDKSNEVECPICFLNYDRINVTKCCSAYICTECFLQMQPPPNLKKPEGGNGSSRRLKTSSAGTCCPFCNAVKLIVHVPSRDAKMSEIAEREEQEQRTIEAKIRASVAHERESVCSSSAAASSSRNSDAGDDPFSSSDSVAVGDGARALVTKSGTAFGASLQKHDSFRKGGGAAAGVYDFKSASSSFDNDDPSSPPRGGGGGGAPFLMSVEERRQLEEEMKRQHMHPVARRMQREAEEARNANAAAAARAGGRGGRFSRRLRDGRASLLSARNSRHERGWNDIVEAFETDGGEIQSLDDLVVIEAAILLSMEEAARQAQQQQENDDAAATSDRGRGGGGRDFHGAQHVRSSFPLLHALMARGGRDGHPDEDDADGAAAAATAAVDGADEDQRSSGRTAATSSVSSRASSTLSNARRGGGSRRRNRSNRSVARDTASLIMRGLSEEEQVAMAIAMSLRDSERQEDASTSGDGAGGANASSPDSDSAAGGRGPSIEANVSFPDILADSEATSDEGANENAVLTLQERGLFHGNAGAATSEE